MAAGQKWRQVHVSKVAFRETFQRTGQWILHAPLRRGPPRRAFGKAPSSRAPMIRDHLDDLEGALRPICIVGAGPVGLSMALELERLGQPVLVLESGGRRAEPEATRLSAAELVDPLRHDDMRIAVARRLGGTSNLWGGRCVPFDEIDFVARNGLPGWPIARHEVMAFVPRACELLSCGEPVFEAPIAGLACADADITHASLERWSMRPRLQIAHGAALAASRLIDIRLHATVADVVFSEAGAVEAVIAVRPDGARTRIRLRHLVLAMGGLETTRLLLLMQRRAPARFGGPGGPLGRYYMGHLIGEVADIGFPSGRIDAAYDFHLDGRGSYVRRRFVPGPQAQIEDDLLNISFWPVVPPMSDPGHRSALLSLAFLALSFPPLGRALVAEAIRVRHVPSPAGPRWPHLRNAGRDLPGAVLAASSFLWKRHVAAMRMPGLFVRNAARRYGLSYHAEQSPRADSRVRLIGEVDAAGLPRLEIDYRVHPDDVASVMRAHDRLGAWLGRTGFGELDYRGGRAAAEKGVAAQVRHGTHQIGTARMAANAAEGVVDGDLRVFGVPNLHVASSAVLPRSGQANPTLTTVALGLRLAHRLSGPAALRPAMATALASVGAAAARP